MPLLNTITTPYAEAFLQVASTRKEDDQVIDQAKAVLEVWNQSPELSQAMSSPVLEVDAKKAAIEKLFAKEVTPSFLNLMKLLADRQRIGLLGAVLERLLELFREQRNIALATVTSATSSTTQVLALMLKILDQHYAVKRAMMTTIHAYRRLYMMIIWATIHWTLNRCSGTNSY